MVIFSGVDGIMININITAVGKVQFIIRDIEKPGRVGGPVLERLGMKRMMVVFQLPDRNWTVATTIVKV
jgi:hypothetical protein